MRAVLPIATVIFTVLTLPAVAAADTTYSYTGELFNDVSGPPYTTSQRVAGSFTTTAPLPRNRPLSSLDDELIDFSFSDGVQTRTPANTFVNELRVSTDADGQIDAWRLVFQATPPATMIGEVRDVLVSIGPDAAADEGGTGFCLTVTSGICTSFTLTDFGRVLDDPGTWTRSGEVPPVPETYSYLGETFTEVSGPPYTTAQRVAGSFTLATPLAPDLPLTEVRDALIDYAFSDGVETRTAEDSYVVSFQVGTAADGRVNRWQISVVESPPATMVGDVRHTLDTVLTLDPPLDQGGTGTCDVVTDGLCSSFILTDFGKVEGDPGTWAGAVFPSPTGYAYEGNPFTFVSGPPYDLSLRLDGTLTTVTPLPPSMALTDIRHSLLAFDFGDGVQTRDETDSTIFTFRVGTDAGGAIDQWSIAVAEAPPATMVGEVRALIDSSRVPGFESDQGGSGPCDQVAGGQCSSYVLDVFGRNDQDPGTWTGGATVLDIPTLSWHGLLLLASLLAAAAWALLARRR